MRKQEEGIKLVSTLPPEAIQNFLNDTFLSGESLVGEARAWKLVLEIYAMKVGQKINFDKSKVFFFNTPLDIQQRIGNFLACNVADLPNTYSGLPLTMKEVSVNF